MKGHINVGLPIEMTRKIDELIKKNKVKEIYGFNSRAEFVRYATSKFIKEVLDLLEPSIERGD